MAEEDNMAEEINPIVAGRIRGGRDDGRPSEDDLTKAKLGEQGIPGKPPKPQIVDDDQPQNPGGHTA